MNDTSWDHALEITADGNRLVGHAGAVLGLPSSLTDCARLLSWP